MTKPIEKLEEELGDIKLRLVTGKLLDQIWLSDNDIGAVKQAFARLLREPELAKEYDRWQRQNHIATGFPGWLADRLEGKN